MQMSTRPPAPRYDYNTQLDARETERETILSIEVRVTPESMSLEAKATMPKTCNITLETLTTLPCGHHAGWLDQPEHRGTFDIIWTCLFTTFIATYTVMCLNLPAPQDGRMKLIGRRLKWMWIGVLGPEIVLTYAAGQWSRAKHSVKAFQESGFDQWSMRQAFFADMGGFVFHARASEPFPLNAKQLHWLVVNGHVEYPNVTADEIWDKSKQDTLAKGISAFQMGYLIIQIIGRAVQHLPITLLELNAVAIVICSILTSLCWLHKPQDIRNPIRIKSDDTMADIIKDQVWCYTPLDFVDENGPGWSMNLQPFMGMPTIPAERPIQRIPNDRFPMNPYGPQEYYLCFATLIFTAVHVAGWNYSFPTEAERILWRISSLILFGATAAFWLFETIASWVRLGRWTMVGRVIERRKGRSESVEDKVEVARPPSSVNADTAFEPTVLPLLWEFCAITPLAIVFALARAFLLAEGFMELRSLLAATFLSVNWSMYLPHT